MKRSYLGRMGCLIFMVISGLVSGSTADGTKVYQNAEYPRIGMMWASLRGNRSLEAIAKHDMVMLGAGELGLQLENKFRDKAEKYTPESIEVAKQKVKKLRELNPDILIIGDMLFYEWPEKWLPEDHPWWLRKDDKRVQFWPGTYRMNWNDAGYRHCIAQWTLSLKESGVDGVFYDNLREEPDPWIALLKEVREKTGDDFLIFANAGYDVGAHDFAAPYLNGIMYESGWSHNRTEWDTTIQKMQHTETLLRKPTISLIERFEDIQNNAGWPNNAKNKEERKTDPQARRWSLCYALIIGDYCYLFSDNTSHRHDWYPEYDVKIGKPLDKGVKVESSVWKRNYEKAEVYVNLPGALKPYSVNFAEEKKEVFTGISAKSFIIEPGEGKIFINFAAPGKNSE